VEPRLLCKRILSKHAVGFPKGQSWTKMGGVCGKCSDVEKGKKGDAGKGGMKEPEQDEFTGSESGDEEGSEVVASSEEEVDGEDKYKQDVIETLKGAGASLKRGKTMAMKEAITTAKKLNLDTTVITQAEKQLEDHKKQQRREQQMQEVTEFMESNAATEIPSVEKMLKKAQEAECDDKTIGQLKERLELLVATRPLEMDECEQAREYMKKSCADFVRLATKGGGRPVVFLNLEDGKKISAKMILSATLENLVLQVEGSPQLIEVPVISLSARAASKDPQVQSAKGFGNLKGNDSDCSVALKHDNGVWCVIEPTPIRRDRLVEAILILTEACKAAPPGE